MRNISTARPLAWSAILFLPPPLYRSFLTANMHPRLSSLAAHSPRDFLTLLSTSMQLINTLPASFIFANTPYTFPWQDERHKCTEAYMGRNLWTSVGRLGVPAEQEKAYRDLSRSLDSLREINPRGGTYGNEADVYEPDCEHVFWGENYEELVRVKRKFDPGHLLD
ncbi:hypothetical protein EDD85DRAFT_134549 [Armillaria nabsnona]|nr:hypothetical protein EDD85DRAFT_134549 [Armillaria nabsnona]